MSISDLVSTAINACALSIAIRFHRKNRRIHIVDNGHGLSFDSLMNIGESSQINHCSIKSECQVYITMRQTASMFVIMSKHCDSNTTNIKIFREGCLYELKQTEDRPAPGTTMIIYFNENSWNANFSLTKITRNVACLALANPQISFSIVDDERDEVLLQIKKSVDYCEILKIILGNSVNLRCIHSLTHEINHNMKLTGYYGYDLSKDHQIQEFFIDNRSCDSHYTKKAVVLALDEFIDSIGEKSGIEFNLKRENIFFLLYICTSISMSLNFTSFRPLPTQFHDDKSIISTLKFCIFIILKKIRNPSEIESNFTKSSSLDPRLVKRKSYFTNYNFIPQRLNLSSALFKNNEKIISERQRKRKIFFPYSPIILSKKISFSNSSCISHFVAKKNISSLSKIAEKCTDLHIDDRKISQAVTVNELENGMNPVAMEQVTEEKMIDKIDNSLEHISLADVNIDGDWSDWFLEPSPVKNQQTSNENDLNFASKNYRFLPVHLKKLLHLQTNLVDRKYTQEFTSCLESKRRCDPEVRPCQVQHKREIMLRKNALDQMKVMNQINSEFIAATTIQDEERIVILIDQHAMDERIRYENLLRDYKDGNRLRSVTLKFSIMIDDIPKDIVSLLLTNQEFLLDFGVTLSSRKSTTTLIITSIPQCFAMKKYSDVDRLTVIVRTLLMELAEILTSGSNVSNMPLTIHNVIASEACHGAIKFGDPLTRKRCNVLVNYWRETDLPNRCAHGRPVIIPLLLIDLKNHEKSNINKEKLNFQRLNDNLRAAYDSRK